MANRHIRKFSHIECKIANTSPPASPQQHLPVLASLMDSPDIMIAIAMSFCNNSTEPEQWIAETIHLSNTGQQWTRLMSNYDKTMLSVLASCEIELTDHEIILELKTVD